jgi:hypothetical protein
VEKIGIQDLTPQYRLYRGLMRVDWQKAFGELSLIIIGVLAALAVNAWWDSRMTRRLNGPASSSCCWTSTRTDPQSRR